ncbi:MAG TPA: hypothetical protein VGS41_07745, partial [Chthonomonadales bacterium]|nr:hypothetical protein [Chthonomonadales bacterium]
MNVVGRVAAMARFGAILASCWALAGLMAIIAFPGTLAAAQGKPPLPGAGVPGFGPLVMPDDPGHSAIWGLMMRPDVINAINVDLQQQDAIRALYSKAQSSLQMKLRPGAVARERGG